MPAPYDSSPAIQTAAVTTGDTSAANFPACRALFVGTGGNIVPVMENGGTATLKNVPNGTILPIRCIRVNTTNTTASDIVALY